MKKILVTKLFPLAAFVLLAGQIVMAQDASAMLGAAAKAMGISSLASIEYKGLAAIAPIL